MFMKRGLKRLFYSFCGGVGVHSDKKWYIADWLSTSSRFSQKAGNEDGQEGILEEKPVA
jgi:hypothetical protein